MKVAIPALPFLVMAFLCSKIVVVFLCFFFVSRGQYGSEVEGASFVAVSSCYFLSASLTVFGACALLAFLFRFFLVCMSTL